MAGGRKKIIVVGTILIVVLAIVGGLWFYKGKQVSSAACLRLADLGRYSQLGMNTTSFDSTLFVSSEIPGERGFYASVSAYDQVNTPGHKVYTIASQSGVMDYFLGYFDSWVKINNSTDKLIEVRDGKGGKVYQFRVAFKNIPSWEDNATRVSFGQTDVKPVALEKLASDNQVYKIRKNDVVVLIPAYFIPDFQKKDDQGNIWVGEIIDYGCVKEAL